MSLIQELLALRQQKLDEDAIEVQSADQVWQDNGTDSKTFISNAVYYVRPMKDTDKFEIVVEANNQRKPFATLTKADLDKSFTPMRANQTPDAEGFTQYRDIDETEAFEYTGDTINVETGSTTVTLAKGDYLLRRADGNDFIYSTKKSTDFEANFAEK
jgi:hypothetical protein